MSNQQTVRPQMAGVPATAQPFPYAAYAPFPRPGAPGTAMQPRPGLYPRPGVPMASMPQAAARPFAPNMIRPHSTTPGKDKKDDGTEATDNDAAAAAAAAAIPDAATQQAMMARMQPVRPMYSMMYPPVVPVLPLKPSSVPETEASLSMDQRALLAQVERVDRQIVSPESTQIFVRLLMKRSEKLKRAMIDEVIELIDKECRQLSSRSKQTPGYTPTCLRMSTLIEEREKNRSDKDPNAAVEGTATMGEAGGDAEDNEPIDPNDPNAKQKEEARAAKAKKRKQQPDFEGFSWERVDNEVQKIAPVFHRMLKHVSSNPTQHRVRARQDRAVGLAVASILDHRSAGMRVGLDYFVYESQHEREQELKKRAEEERERWRKKRELRDQLRPGEPIRGTRSKKNADGGTTTDGEGAPPRKRTRTTKNGTVKKKVKVSGKKKGANAGTTPAKQTATTGTAQRVLRTTGLAGTAPAPHPTNAPNVMTTDLPYLDMHNAAALANAQAHLLGIAAAQFGNMRQPGEGGEEVRDVARTLATLQASAQPR